MTNFSPKRIGFVMRQAPYGNSLAQDALDTVLASAAYEQCISLIFLADGVFQLLPAQNSHSIGQKNLEKQLSALGLYGVEQIYVCQTSLRERGLSVAALSLASAKPLEPLALAELLHTQDCLLSF
jgi:tRNA 2-thiouridine synthesizing protein C